MLESVCTALSSAGCTCCSAASARALAAGSSGASAAGAGAEAKRCVAPEDTSWRQLRETRRVLPSLPAAEFVRAARWDLGGSGLTHSQPLSPASSRQATSWGRAHACQGDGGREWRRLRGGTPSAGARAVLMRLGCADSRPNAAGAALQPLLHAQLPH